MAAQLGTSTFRGAQLQTAQPFTRCSTPGRLQIVALKPIQGKVVSTSMTQTAVVQVSAKRHRSACQRALRQMKTERAFCSCGQQSHDTHVVLCERILP